MLNDDREMPALNTVCIDELRNRGLDVKLQWTVRCPSSGTALARYLVCDPLEKRSIQLIIHTYHDGSGWEAYTAPNTIGVQETVDDVITRLYTAEAPKPFQEVLRDCNERYNGDRDG